MEPDPSQSSKELEEEISRTVKEHGELISREKARELISNKNQPAPQKRKLTAAALIAANLQDGEVVDLEDNVYRVFNKVKFNRNGSAGVNRIVVFGSEGNSVKTILWEKSAEFPDAMQIQRKDKVLATNLRVHKNGDETELYSSTSTYFSRITPSKSSVTDFSQLKGGERNIDIIGRIVSIGSSRSFKSLGGTESSVSDCNISDGKIEARVSLWGSCSTYTTEMHPGEFLKVEFASAKLSENGLELSASDASRMLISKRAL